MALTRVAPADPPKYTGTDTNKSARAMLNLPIDDASMRAALRERFPGYRTVWSFIPITRSEARILDERNELHDTRGRNAIVNVVRRSPDEIAGAWFSWADRGWLVLNLAPGADEWKWRRLVGAIYEFPERVKYVRVSRSKTELEVEKERFSRLVPVLTRQGVEVTSYGIDDRRVRLNISVAGNVSAARRLIAKEFPEANVEFGARLYAV